MVKCRVSDENSGDVTSTVDRVRIFSKLPYCRKQGVGPHTQVNPPDCRILEVV